VISKVINVRQLTFFKGRGLLDIALVTNEVLEYMKRRNRMCVFFKVDFEKAYDSVSWEFLLYMLDMVGFCAKWIKSVWCCLESASVSFL